MNWTAEQIDQIMDMLLVQKMSFGDIARHFGVTRSSIAGRVRREKARRGIPPNSKFQNRTSEKADKPRKRRADMLTLPARADFALSAYVQTGPQKPSEGFLASIVDVNGCRWPVKDDPAYVGGVAFCNHATDGKTYCPYHTQESVATYSRKLIKKTVKDAIFVYTKRNAA